MYVNLKSITSMQVKIKKKRMEAKAKLRADQLEEENKCKNREGIEARRKLIMDYIEKSDNLVFMFDNSCTIFFLKYKEMCVYRVNNNNIMQPRESKDNETFYVLQLITYADADSADELPDVESPFSISKLRKIMASCHNDMARSTSDVDWLMEDVRNTRSI